MPSRQLSLLGIFVVAGLIGAVATIMFLGLDQLGGRPTDWALLGANLFLVALMASACYRGAIWATPKKN